MKLSNTTSEKAKLERLKAKEQRLCWLPIIQELPAYEALSLEEKQRHIKVWDEYYARVRQGKAAKLFYESRAALKRGDLETVRANADKARKALAANWEEDLGRPEFRDPYEYTNNSDVQTYKLVTAAIAELEGKAVKAPF